MGSGVHGVHGEPAAEPVTPGSVSVNASVIIPGRPSFSLPLKGSFESRSLVCIAHDWCSV